MEVERKFISGCPPMILPPIPEVCKGKKTIYNNVLGQLIIHVDRRPEAVKWLEEVFPKLLVCNKTKEEVMNFFWSTPQECWFELDLRTRILNLCMLKKK